MWWISRFEHSFSNIFSFGGLPPKNVKKYIKIKLNVFLVNFLAIIMKFGLDGTSALLFWYLKHTSAFHPYVLLFCQNAFLRIFSYYKNSFMTKIYRIESQKLFHWVYRCEWKGVVSIIHFDIALTFEIMGINRSFFLSKIKYFFAHNWKFMLCKLNFRNDHPLFE